jgi:dipeptidyl aminopeptidase/acylaminoacyl peptidase
VLHTLAGFNLPFMHMSFSPDGRHLFVSSGDKTVTVWNTATGEKRRQLSCPNQTKERPKPPGDQSCEAFLTALSPDGKLLAFGLQSNGRDPGILPILDTASGKEVRCFTTGKDGVSALEFSPDGRSLAWGGWREGTVYLGEIASGRERRRFTGHQGRIFSLAFAADGQRLISGSEDTTALVWDLTGRLTTKKLGKALSAEELETHWKTLAAEDAEPAFRAIQALSAAPAHSVPYLRARLHPVAPGDEKRVQQWIADLDSDQFAVREKATSELQKAGATALQAMRKALEERPALEKRRRLEPLIEMQEREEWSPSADNLRARRALEVLERVGTAEAKNVLTMLAKGAPGAWLTEDAKGALQRLAHRPAR